MKNFFGFIDESGVLADVSQRFFGVGFLKIENTEPFYEELVKEKSKVISGLSRLKKPFEYKFNTITSETKVYYQNLINLYFRFPENYFCAFIIDKHDPNFNLNRYFKDVWQAYISYSKLVVKNNTKKGELIAVLADYITKPSSSTLFYETELRKFEPKIFNVTLLESHASLFIQMVDVLLGCVLFDFYKAVNPKRKEKEAKREIVDSVREKLGKESLARKFTVEKPNYFNVWPFKGK